MHKEQIHLWRHSHSFGQELKQFGESRTVIVVTITAVMMVVEIVAGLVFGSMALLADGLHMGSHAVALGIAVFAYVYARRHAHDERFSFGTGKVNALGGYTGAVLLALFAFMMAWQSVERLLHPIAIAFNQAIAVAVLGLIVNGVSMLILGQKRHEHHHDGDHDHNHHHHDHHHDHNLRSAYLHVLADALTSLTAVFALLTGKYLGWVWMDPVMGIVGAGMVAMWSRGLLRACSTVLLDMQAPEELRGRIRQHIEGQDDNRVADLHVWSIGPNRYAAAISVVTHQPRPASHYHGLLPEDPRLVHTTIEVHRCEK